MTSHRIGVSNACQTNDNNGNEKMEREQAQNAKSTCRKKKTRNEETHSMTEHIETRRKIKEIADISSFNELLEKTLLSDEEKSLLQLHYIQSKDFRYIGDMLGYSESTIKKKHKKILKKISKVL